MIAGYCWPQSARHNQTVTLYCHADEATRIRLRVVRQGSDDVTVLDRTGVAVQPQQLADDVAAEGCTWQPCADLVIDPSWPSGFYLIRLEADQGQAEAFFVVRASEPRDAMLVLSTSTWAAYNNWGGPSFYTGGQTSSLQRPLPKGFLAKRDPHRHRIARYADWSKDDARAFDASSYSRWCMAAGWANCFALPPLSCMMFFSTEAARDFSVGKTPCPVLAMAS